MKLSGDVIVTGGCGAIGSNLVKRILREPEVERVVVIDDLSQGNPWLLPEDERVEFHQESVTDCYVQTREPIIFHLAAHFANALSWEEPRLDTETNVLGTVNMLDLARTWNARLFVFASAGCASGHEDSPYQVSKAAGEAYCRCFFHEVPSAVFRFHNSYGPGEVPGPWRNVIPRWLWASMTGQAVTLYGDGNDARDFVYVDDVVERLIEAEPMLAPQEIGTGRLTTVSQLVSIIQQTTGVALLKRVEPRRRWDHVGRAAAIERRPHVSLCEGLRRTWAWFQENREQIERSIR